METYNLQSNILMQLWTSPCCNKSVLCQKKLKEEASKSNSSRNEYNEDSEYEKDKSSFSDSDNISGAKQYDL